MLQGRKKKYGSKTAIQERIGRGKQRETGEKKGGDRKKLSY